MAQLIAAVPPMLGVPVGCSCTSRRAIILCRKVSLPYTTSTHPLQKSIFRIARCWITMSVRGGPSVQAQTQPVTVCLRCSCEVDSHLVICGGLSY